MLLHKFSKRTPTISYNCGCHTYITLGIRKPGVRGAEELNQNWKSLEFLLFSYRIPIYVASIPKRRWVFSLVTIIDISAHRGRVTIGQNTMQIQCQWVEWRQMGLSKAYTFLLFLLDICIDMYIWIRKYLEEMHTFTLIYTYHIHIPTYIINIVYIEKYIMKNFKHTKVETIV